VDRVNGWKKCYVLGKGSGEKANEICRGVRLAAFGLKEHHVIFFTLVYKINCKKGEALISQNEG
jgi:hypothetical protein